MTKKERKKIIPDVLNSGTTKTVAAQKAKAESARAHWFKPGVSGNPSGRPKGTTFSNWMKKLAFEEIKNGADKGKTYAEIAARALWREAMKGEVAPSDFIAERTEGKVAQKFEIEDRREKLMKLAEADPAALASQLLDLGKRLRNYGQRRDRKPD